MRAVCNIHRKHGNGGLKMNLESDDADAKLNTISASATSNWFGVKFSDLQRLLHLAFTLREAGAKIRVISSRDMRRKERVIYEQAA